MKHSKALVAILVATFVVFGFIGIASAHTPSVQPTCTGLSINLVDYEGNIENNVAHVTIDGGVFDIWFDHGVSKTLLWSLQPTTVSHTWSAAIDANLHTGNPTKFDKTFSGVQQPCQQATTTTSVLTATTQPSTTTAVTTTAASSTSSTSTPTVPAASAPTPSSPSSSTSTPAASSPSSVVVSEPATQEPVQPAESVPAVVAVGEPPKPPQGRTAPSPRALPATCFRSVGCEGEGGDATPLVMTQLTLALAAGGIIAGAVVMFVTRNRKAHS